MSIFLQNPNENTLIHHFNIINKYFNAAFIINIFSLHYKKKKISEKIYDQTHDI